MQKKRWFILVGIGVAVLSLAVLAAACGDDDDGDGNGAPTATEEPADGDGGEATTVDTSLRDDFTLTLSVDTAAPGTVTFSVTNEGPALPHNLRVIRTDEAPDALPVADNQVDESAVDVVASTSGDLDAGGAEDVVAELEAGNYVVICNFIAHYEAGMRVAFTIE